MNDTTGRGEAQEQLKAGAEDSRTPFGRRMRELRDQAGLSLRALAAVAHYGKSRLSDVETGAQPPTEELAAILDRVLQAEGELVMLAAVQLRGWPRPEQLPPGVPVLVGREDDLVAVLAGASEDGTATSGARVVVLHGPPGVGKTALARVSAVRLLEQCPDGALFRDLQTFSAAEPVSPAAVLDGFLRALGVHSSAIPAEMSERAALFRSMTHDRAMLVMLDNVGDMSQVDLLLPNSPSSIVLLTSRHRPLLTTVTKFSAVEVAPLRPEQAVALLSRIIGERRVAREPDRAAEIARTCDHSPLALCIAAESIAQRPHHSLAELTAELGALRLLDAAAEKNALPVRTLFSWSYRALPAEQAKAFRRLSLHPGEEVATGTVAAMLATSPEQARTLLDGLARAHLVQETECGWWRLHDLLRVYAAELALSQDTSELRHRAVRRLVSWYLHTSFAAEQVLAPQRTTLLVPEPLVDGVCPAVAADPASASGWYDCEQGNLPLIVSLAIDNGLFAEAWQLVVTLWGWLLLRMPTDLWNASHIEGLRAARAAEDVFGEAWILVNHAFLMRLQGRLEEAASTGRRSLQLRERIGDLHGQAWSHTGLGFVASDGGRPDESLHHFATARGLFERTEDLPHGRAITLVGQGEAYARLGETETARHYWQDALVDLRQLDDKFGLGWTLAKLGKFESDLGRYGAAVAALEDSLEARRDSDDHAGAAESLMLLGDAHKRVGDLESAGLAWRQALVLYGKLGDPKARQLDRRLSAVDNPQDTW